MVEGRPCGKDIYPNRKEAKRARKRVFEQHGAQCHIYACKKCRGFHLTKFVAVRGRRGGNRKPKKRR